MKRFIQSVILLISLSVVPLNSQVLFEGASDAIVTTTPNPSTGLEAIYVLRNAEDVAISYRGETNVTWSRFGSRGAAYAETIGIGPSIVLDSSDCGYIAEFGGRAHYFWIVNYANHTFSITDFEQDPDMSDCQNTVFKFSGSADPITVYSINGRPETLNRDISVSYTSLDFDDETDSFRPADRTKSFQQLGSTVVVEASLCDTQFILSGDRFQKVWGCEQSVETQLVKSISISAETNAEQVSRDIDNEQVVIGAALGGSAPCEIIFTAAVSDGASFVEWQLSHNSDFDPIDDRYQQTEVAYTFREQGMTYVRFFAANEDGGCEYYSSVYEVSIGESALLCPNAFSPQSTPGVNDEWKVSYKSLISFDCHIFNRWGVEMCSFSDPSQGWDGKYKGKFVPAGTYYYVIKARGSDGREYKLSGDINIINSKNKNLSDSYAE